MASSQNVKPKQKSKFTKQAASKLITHIHLNDKYLKSIDLSACSTLTVLYLYNNQIEEIINLESAVNLESLYLQNNRIRRIENLQNLRKLKKLYLGRNEISVLEGLENMRKLQELYIEKQRLPCGESMCFDPRTIFALSQSLCILDVSYNQITSLAPLEELVNIQMLNAGYNKLCDAEEVCKTIQNWYYLEEATFTGNYIAKKHRYRENIIANTHRLKRLDGKEISETTRCFIKKFKDSQINHTASTVDTINVGDTVPSFARRYPLAVQKAVTLCITKESRSAQDIEGRDQEDYVAWNALPPLSYMNVTELLPPMLKRQRHRNSKSKVVMSTTFPQL